MNEADPSGDDPTCTDSGGGDCVVEGIPVTWNEYYSVTDAVLHHKGGITPNLLQGILVITWQESYGSGYAGNAQQTVDSLLQYGLPQTQDVDEDGCSATPTSQALSGFRCFEYGVLGVYAENQNAGGTPTTGAVSELKDAKVHAVEYLFLLEEQHWAEGVLEAAELAHDLGEVSDYFPELFEIAAAATAYVAPTNCASSPTRVETV